MFDYFCGNCFTIVGKWKIKYEGFNIKKYCNIEKENNKIFLKKFLLCKKCNTNVGILCFNICTKCFGDKTLVGTNKELNKWFDKYKITQQSINDIGVCYTCKGSDFRKEPQPLFVNLLTFEKESNEYNKYMDNLIKELKNFYK